jgi:hypothetical protein
MRIGLLYSAQHAALAVGLRAMLPRAEIISFDAAQFERDPAAAADAAASLRACDHLISQDVPARFGPLSTAALRHATASCHMLPPLFFGGYHPDVIGLELDGSKLPGPTGLLHSRIAVLAYLTGHTPDEAAALFNRLVFSRLGYLSAFARERAALLRRFRAYNIDITPIFDSWAASGCFMHAPHTPTLAVMFDLARLVCDMIGAPPDDATLEQAIGVTLRATADPLARLATHPVFPEIAAQLRIPASGDFRPAQPDGAPPGTGPVAFRPNIFLAGSYDSFQRVPRATLHAAPGIMEGLALLGLREIDPAGSAARAAASAAPPDAQAFLTWHGTLLLVDAGSRMVIQRPLRPETTDATELLAPHPLTLDTIEHRLALLGGVSVRAGLHPGTAALSRNGTWLSAAPERLAVSFGADAIGDWESFLPLSRPALDALRHLLRGGWTRPDGSRVPRATIRLEPGFRLRIGADLLPLQEAAPRLDAASGQAGDITIGQGPGALTLRPDPADPDADIVLDPPPSSARPPLVGSPEAFRAEPSARLRLSAPETCHLPFTASNEHAAWLFNAVESGTALGLGRAHAEATLWRTQDTTVLLAPGLEGMCASRAGVWKDHDVLLDKRGAASAAASGLLRAAPTTVIDDPVCVFYSPRLHNYAHWTAGALVGLHAMQPNLPENFALLLPPATAAGPKAAAPKRGRSLAGHRVDFRASLAALGFGELKTVQANGEAVLARQAIFLQQPDIGMVPAAVLRSFRDRACALNPPLAVSPEQDYSRIYVKRRGSRAVGNSAMVDKIMESMGFRVVHTEDLSQAHQISLFGGARVVVAAHGAALANLLFCQTGTRVVELSPRSAFRPRYWRIAEKLGLAYGVLPCQTANNAFDAGLIVDVQALRRLLRLLGSIKAAPGSGRR